MSLQHFTTATAIPAAVADGTNKAARSDAFGAIHTRNEVLAWAEEGSYFRATNATMGTGIAMGIQTTFSATANVLFAMRNGSSTKKVIPHYIRLVCTVAGASTTASNLAVVMDTATRYSSGGTDLSAQVVNANSGLAPTTAVDQIRFGALTCSAASAARIVGRCILRTQTAPCWAVGDEVRIHFDPNGDADGPVITGAGPLIIPRNFGPVVLGGQNHTLLLHMWNTANATTAPSWEIECAWWER